MLLVQDYGTMAIVTLRGVLSVSDKRDPLIQLQIHPLKKWVGTVQPDSME